MDQDFSAGRANIQGGAFSAGRTHIQRSEQQGRAQEASAHGRHLQRRGTNAEVLNASTQGPATRLLRASETVATTSQ